MKVDYILDLFFASFFTEFILVIIVLCLTKSYGLVSYPKTDRWHTSPTALHGGVSMVLSVFSIGYFDSISLQLNVIFIAYFLIFLVGLIDDFLNFRPIVKLLLQFVAAVVLVYGCKESVGLEYNYGWLILFFISSIFLMNSINLLDNMDGLAAGVVFVLSASVFSYAVLTDDFKLIFLTIISMGVLLGFMIFNVNPAKIFMGDSGSLLLGFLISSYVFLIAVSLELSLKNIFAFISLLMIPILDTLMVFFRRIFSGRSFTQGGRDHLSHRLVLYGFSEKISVMLLIVSQIIWGVISLLLFFSNEIYIYFVFILLFGISVFFVINLMKLKIYNSNEENLFLRRTKLLKIWK